MSAWDRTPHVIGPLVWFAWGGATGLAVATGRLPTQTNLVPILCLALFAALILKEKYSVPGVIAWSAALSGLLLGAAVDLAIAPPCRELRIVPTGQGLREVRCLSYKDLRLLSLQALFASVLVVGGLIWFGSRRGD